MNVMIKDERVTWRCMSKQEADDILTLLGPKRKKEVIDLDDRGIYINITKQAYLHLERIMRERKKKQMAVQKGGHS